VVVGVREQRAGVDGVEQAVGVVVRVAHVSEAVSVRIALVGVGHAGAEIARVGHAVAVEIVVAGVSPRVAVAVELREVRDLRARVAAVAHAVAVSIELIAVGGEGTVVDGVRLAVTVRVIRIGERLAVIGVRDPDGATAPDADAVDAGATASAAFFVGTTALTAQALGVVLRERREREERDDDEGQN
jgi:hypothetical protein